MLDSVRKKEEHELRIRINSQNNYNDIDRRTISILRHNTRDLEYTQRQIDKAHDKINERLETIKTLECRIRDLLAGNLDKELTERMQTVNTEINRKDTIKKDKKRKEIAENKKKSLISKDYHDSIRQSERGNRDKEKEMFRSYKYFWKISDSIPEYLVKKLDTLPNNKGYMWKGMQIYGKLPDDNSNKVTLFEKNKELLTIYEWTKEHYKVSQKKGNEKRCNIIEHTPRIPIHGSNLDDGFAIPGF